LALEIEIAQEPTPAPPAVAPLAVAPSALEPKVRHQRAVIDRRALSAEVADAWQTAESHDAFGARLRDLLKTALKAGRAEVKRRFLADNDGAAAVRANAFLIDQVIRLTHEAATERVFQAANRSDGERIAVVAVGGYGRGEMAPFSDVDLLFLYPYKQTPWVEQVIEFTLYLLWDLGLKLGHSARSIDECMRQAKADTTISTAMLEARFIIGDDDLYREMRGRYGRDIVAGRAAEFVDAKLAESDQRHARLGDSRYVVEPNVKDGKGGLRDLHTLQWIAKFAYQVEDMAALVARGVLDPSEARRFAKAQRHLWSTRCHLHYLVGRAEERLTFDVQAEIAARMGYTDHAGTAAVERFMKHYHLTAKDVGDLTRILCAAVEAEHRRRPRLRFFSMLGRNRDLEGFPLDGDRLSIADGDSLIAEPVDIIRLFHVAQRHDLDIHPNALRLITKNLRLIDGALKKDPEANRLFIEIMTSPKGPERILRRMNEANVFGRFVPDFGRVVAQMQYDMYHVYTVDEHTIFALGIVHRIESGALKDVAPVASEVVHKVLSRRVLYVATLLHDIAKGRGGDHSVLGERVARRLCPRFGLDPAETETVAWLVRWHLLMSNTAFKRDVNDPRTVADFADQVQSPERLRLLLVLTVADIRAVGPQVWNGWKAALLRELYFRTMAVLGGDAAAIEHQPVKAILADLRTNLSEFDDADFAALADRCGPAYWQSFTVPLLARHARLMRQADRAQSHLAIDTREDRERAVTEVTVYAHDHPGLFAQIAGAMAAGGANIVDARIFTLADGRALDIFSIQNSDRQPFANDRALAALKVKIRQAVAGDIDLDQSIAARAGLTSRRAKAFRVPPRVLIDNQASVSHTVIEINGKDRPGVLYAMTKVLSRLNLQIGSARIMTYGERFVDVFYVKDLFGLKVDQERKLAAIRSDLLAVIGGADDPPPSQ